jgi:DNA-binding transcriptional ArsR family regulator
MHVFVQFLRGFGDPAGVKAADFATLGGIHGPFRDRKISKALADETRLKIFEAISATKQMTCGEIVLMRGVTPATVSHNLKILSEAELITCRRAGQFLYSQAVSATISAYARALANIARGKKEARRR